MIDLYHTPRGTVAVSDQAGLCSVCKTMHFWFVNDGGHTRCLDCAEARVEQALAGRQP